MGAKGGKYLSNSAGGGTIRSPRFTVANNLVYVSWVTLCFAIAC